MKKKNQQEQNNSENIGKKRFSKKTKIITIIFSMTILSTFTGLAVVGFYGNRNYWTIQELGSIYKKIEFDRNNNTLNGVQINQEDAIILTNYYTNQNPNLYYEFFNNEINFTNKWNSFRKNNNLKQFQKSNESLSLVLEKYQDNNQLFSRQINNEVLLNYDFNAEKILFPVSIIIGFISLLLIFILVIGIKWKSLSKFFTKK